jgi:lysophospholipase L1-like esterase
VKTSCVLLLVSLLLLSTSRAEADALVEYGDRVWVVGDSNGYLLMKELSRLAKENGVHLRGNPVGGSSVIWWVQKENRNYIWDVRGFAPDAVLVVLGTNEAHFKPHVRRNLPPYFQRLRTLLGHPDVRIVWVGPPRLPQRVRHGADDFRRILEDDLFLDSRECDVSMWADGIHPSVSGRRSWVKWIWSELLRIKK